MFHVTKRLLLRPAWPEDWEAVLAAIADEAIVRNLARAPWPYGPDEAKTFVSRPQDYRLPHFLVVESASGRVIGSAGMGECDGEAEIGYWLARSAWGKGYACEAARGVIRVARSLGHRRLVAGHYADNPRSGRVLRKVGFVSTGQTARRYSAGRGGEVPSIEYTLDLEADAMCSPQAA
ncbi:GNAT family N-acetyltransferase [Qipengyuania marisflavi]|uniref:GNAT family N-acetyltransferase n=1 Tax=Qipengyuania marisflavi TaxID=2486356 RepID=A0A5S3PCJ4_9SPHN|nr:GNAT family N-acetyltransferase [Qipengyuania marisflavi]TMM48969.1 GNAT family N-acetyltransferase [Qipengyuania marisflavi]